MRRLEAAGVITRREFVQSAAAFVAATSAFAVSERTRLTRADIARIDRERILRAAARYLREQPVTITAFSSPRSAGGKHDYFSEGDYWWPDPQNPSGPYIQRDGESNPDNFNDHRLALIRLSVQVPALTAAWLITHDRKYAEHAARHLRAWFVDDATRMSPHLEFAQAIHGRFTGRGTGIIDTLHLVEVARAASVLPLPESDRKGVLRWFTEYLQWMTTSKNGIDEREAKNNHGTCWTLQVAEFARFTGSSALLQECRERFRTVLIPHQVAADGSLPEELRRTKPYGYCLFDLDALAMLCQVLGTRTDDLWHFTTSDGRGMEKVLAWMFPYIEDKKKWPKPPDVQYFDDWPVRQPSLLFGGVALRRPEYVALWRRLDPDPTVPEIIRNFFVRQPILWLS